MSRTFNTQPYKFRVEPRWKWGNSANAGAPARGACGCGRRSGKHYSWTCGYRLSQVQTNTNRRRNEDQAVVLEGLELYFTDPTRSGASCHCNFG
jgi:hypothetical protein